MTTTSLKPVRPTPTQLRLVADVLDCLPLTDSTDLVLVYSPTHTAGAVWLCASARARGVQVRLAPLPKVVDSSLARKFAEMPVAGSSIVVLTDHWIRRESRWGARAVLQLSGPVDNWVDSEAAPNLAGPDLLIASSLRARVKLPWTVDVGLGPDGLVQLRPNGTVEAEVETADGVFVADGAIDVNRVTHWDARLADRPVTLTIVAGHVVEVACADDALRGLISRAVDTHRIDRVRAVRYGVPTISSGFGATPGPLNHCHHGVTVCLAVSQDNAYSPASADLRIDLTATLPSKERHET